ncbi:MAG: peptide chain release factor N(5)-glutamine methyltransferase [Planctomycetota bacterium]
MLGLARAFLDRKGLGEARLESELLVAHALGLDRLGLFMRLDQPIHAKEVDRARDLLVRRGRREPTAYIVGEREFYGRSFAVGPGVLVPRPETELVVDLAREWARGRASSPRVLDIGTGSGCLAITLALELEGARVEAVDLSEDALEWARRNASTLEADVRWHVGDGLEVAQALAGTDGPFDLVVSNPPYVEPSEAESLEPEVREHEPALALYAPPADADFWVRSLVECLPALVGAGGLLLVELGHRQGRRVLEGAKGAEGVRTAQLHDDLDGTPRVLSVEP